MLFKGVGGPINYQWQDENGDWMGVFVSGHIGKRNERLGVTNQGELSRQGMTCSLVVAYFWGSNLQQG